MTPKKSSSKPSTEGGTGQNSSKDRNVAQDRRSTRRVVSKYFKNPDNDSSRDDGETGTKTGSKRKRVSKTKAQPGTKKLKKAEEKEQQPDPTQYQVLKFLLSPSALDLCRPSEESRELAKTTPKAGYRTYSGSTFTPFEELLSALILSRPISHALGHRSIRTILNPPYNFNTAKAIRKAGAGKVQKSMFDARTQHKEKTAIAIVKFADVIAEQFNAEDDTSLEEIRKQSAYDVSKEHELLKTSIFGLGNTGLNIFFRRVQWLWTQSFPFMDERTTDAAASLGLPDDPHELYDSVDAIWEELDTEHFDGKDEDEQKRRAFVELLERIIGAQLEKKITKVLREAEKV